METKDIKLIALNTSESILQDVLTSAKVKAYHSTKKRLKSELWGFDVLPEALQKDLTEDAIETQPEFLRAFIEDLIPHLNEKILKVEELSIDLENAKRQIRK